MSEGRRFCENCGAEIGEANNFCPNCGVAQAPKSETSTEPPPETPETGRISTPGVPGVPPPPQAGGRSWGKIIGIGCGVLILLLLLVVACAVVVGSRAGNKTAPAPVSTPSNSGSSNKAGAKTATGQVQGTVGEPVGLSNSTLTVNDVERDYQPPNRFTKPDAGNEFVRVNVSVNNTSNSPVSLNPIQFQIQDSNGVQRDSQSMTELPSPIKLGDIAPGGTATGNVVIQAPQNDTLQLVYTPSAARRESAIVPL